ncbi:hypothetical protein LguiA_010582 [Lonicera macranthoides]
MSKEVENVEIESPNAEESEEFWPLSGKPYFDVILTKTHIKSPHLVTLPAKLHPILPYSTVPVVIEYQGKTWETSFGKRSRQEGGRVNLKAFVEDNDLKMDDACVFELAECSSEILKFKVQILRGDFPAELLAKVNGETSNTPIIID